MRKKILLRVDGGRIWGVSFGHLYRCLALAKELRRWTKADIVFMVKKTEEAVKIVETNGFRVLKIPSRIDDSEEIDFINKTWWDIVIFDLIDLEKKRLEKLKAGGVVVIDDTGNKEISADLVINGSIVKEFHKYIPVKRNTKFYLGPKYCILGEEFDRLPSLEIAPEVTSVLISMGGSDLSGLTVKVMEALVENALVPVIHVILGVGFREEKKINKIIEKASASKIFLHKNVPNMAQMMRQADIGITAGGRTAYELAASGVPGIIIPSSFHEVKVAETFGVKGIFLPLSQWDKEKFIELLKKLINNYHLRKKMSEEGQKLVDSEGRRRVRDILLKEFFN